MNINFCKIRSSLILRFLIRFPDGQAVSVACLHRHLRKPEGKTAIWSQPQRAAILVDAARRKSAQKRLPASLPEGTNLPVEDAITLDTALEELQRENPLQARIVDCRFLLGMTTAETAAALGLSKRKVEREWQDTKARLGAKMNPAKE